jgi:tetratricopeptide (TPR) repeat protein
MSFYTCGEFSMSRSCPFSHLALILLLSPTIALCTPAIVGRSPALAQTTTPTDQKAEENRVLQQCRQDLQKNQNEAAVKSCNEALATFRQLKNRGGEAKALNNLGVAYNALRDYNKAIAYHEQSLAIAREIKDRLVEGVSLLNLSHTYLSLGNREKATELSQQTLVNARDLKNPDLEKSALEVLNEATKTASSTPASPQKVETDRLLEQGLQQAQNRQFQSAKQSLESVLTLYQQIQDRRGEGYALALLGLTYGSLGNNTKAVELSQRTVIIARELKDPQLEKLALGVLDVAQKTEKSAEPVSSQKAEADRLFQQGIQQYQVSQSEAALQSWQQALVMYRELKDRRGEGNALGSLGGTYGSLGNYTKAIEFFKQRLAIAQELKDPLLESTTLGGLAVAYTMMGNYGKAIEHGEQYLAISQEIKYDRGERISLAFLGNAYLRSGDYHKAITFYERFLAVARKNKDRKEESDALGLLSDAYKNSDYHDKAIKLQKQGLEIAREIKDRQAEGNALVSLGNASEGFGNYSQAITYQEQALAIRQELKDRDGESTVLNNLVLRQS